MNIIYILILFAHVGPMGDGNSNALQRMSLALSQHVKPQA